MKIKFKRPPLPALPLEWKRVAGRIMVAMPATPPHWNTTARAASNARPSEPPPEETFPEMVKRIAIRNGVGNSDEARLIRALTASLDKGGRAEPGGILPIKGAKPPGDFFADSAGRPPDVKHGKTDGKRPAVRFANGSRIELMTTAGRTAGKTAASVEQIKAFLAENERQASEPVPFVIHSRLAARYTAETGLALPPNFIIDDRVGRP